MPKPQVITEFEALWTVKDVADYLKVSESWVYKRAEAGELPHVRIVRHLRFEPEEIRRWVRGHAEKPAPSPTLAIVGADE